MWVMVACAVTAGIVSAGGVMTAGVIVSDDGGMFSAGFVALIKSIICFWNACCCFRLSCCMMCCCCKMFVMVD